MRFTPANIMNSVALFGIAAVLVTAGMAQRDPGVDPITTASVPDTAGNATTQAQSYIAAARRNAHVADRFMVVDHSASKTCIFALHRAEGYDVHRVEPGEGCGTLSNRLTDARAWQEMPNGTITITDRAGDPILRLGPSDGFAYEVTEPAYLTMSLEAF